MAFNMFPFTNLHNLNTDWILNTIKDLKTAAETAASQVQEALQNAVLYTSQSKDTSSRKVACANIHAVSYDSAPLGTSDASQARSNIGAAAASDLTDVVRTSEQSLTDAQKTQARNNIEAADQTTVSGLVHQMSLQVLKVTEQSWTDSQKTQARTNIGAVSQAELPDVSDVVRTSAQSLTDAQKAQARDNIGTVPLSEYNNDMDRIDNSLESHGDRISALETSDTTQAGQISALQADTASVVKYTVQTLTEAQKLRARLNIGAAAGGDPSSGVLQANIVEDSQGNYTLDGMAPNELAEALLQDYMPVFVFIFPYDQSYVMSLTDLQASEPVSQNYVITGTALKNRTIYTVSIQIINDEASITVTTEPVDYPVRQQVTGASVTITPAAGVFYECSDTITEIQINTPGTDIHHLGWTVRFTTGSTAPRTVIPATIRGVESFAAEANTTYEINVLDNLAVVGSWAVSV